MLASKINRITTIQKMQLYLFKTAKQDLVTNCFEKEQKIGVCICNKQKYFQNILAEQKFLQFFSNL